MKKEKTVIYSLIAHSRAINKYKCILEHSKRFRFMLTRSPDSLPSNENFLSELRSIVNQMEKKTFSAEELFYDHIKERVAGNADQTPEYNIIRNSGHDGGDFVFKRKNN